MTWSNNWYQLPRKTKSSVSCATKLHKLIYKIKWPFLSSFFFFHFKTLKTLAKAGVACQNFQLQDANRLSSSLVNWHEHEMSEETLFNKKLLGVKMMTILSVCEWMQTTLGPDNKVHSIKPEIFKALRRTNSPNSISYSNHMIPSRPWCVEFRHHHCISYLLCFIIIPVWMHHHQTGFIQRAWQM